MKRDLKNVLEGLTPSRILGFLFGLIAVEALATVIYLLSMPADPKNIVFLGYSLRRLVVVAGVVAAMIAACALAVRAARRPAWSKKIFDWISRPSRTTQLGLFIATLFFFGGWILSWTPPYRFKDYELIFKGLQPLIIWLTIVLGELILLLLVRQYALNWGRLRTILHEQRVSLWVSIIVLGLIVLLWLVIAVSGLGIKHDLAFWNEAGVPLLGVQVLLSWMGGMLVLLLANVIHGKAEKESLAVSERVNGWGFKVDILICVLIWIIAAVLWVREPQVASYFAPDPRLPNNEFYPLSDAADYDLTAQYALIGQKLGDGYHVDKPLYSTFIILLHVLGGQNFNRVTAVQTAFLALLPVFLYLIGKSLHSRPAGVVIALLAVFKGINAIASARMLLSANPRLLVSEYPLMLGLALMTLWLVEWSKQVDKKFLYVILTGGTLGLLTLVRNNVWIYLPVLLLVIWIVLYRRWKRSAVYSILFIGALVLSTIPWMWRSYKVTGTPFYLKWALGGVVWDKRYVPIEPTAVVPESTTSPVPTNESAGSNPTATVMAVTPTSIPPAGVSNPPSLLVRFKEAAAFIPAHLVHNFVATALILPTSLVNDDLRHMISAPDSLWQTDWGGGLSFTQVLLLLIDLAFFAVGVGVSWKNWKAAGMMPLIVYLSYNLGAAVARTSGGRYIVPTEWGVYFYFAIGLVQVTYWLAAMFGFKPVVAEAKKDELPAPIKTRRSSFLPALVVSAGLLLIGATPLIPDVVFPKLYPDQTKKEIYQFLISRGVVDKMGFDRAELDAFIASEDSVVLRGRALFPRFYYSNTGEPSRGIYQVMSFPRLAFVVIGPRGDFSGIMPSSNPKQFPVNFPDAANVVVLGCDSGDVNILAVVILGKKDIVYVRSPSTPLACPLTVPVCTSDTECK